MNKPLKERLAKKTTLIPLKDIIPSRFGVGIRGKDTYEQRKEDIKENGLIQNPRVFSLEKGKYEVYIGDHRIRIVKELHAEGSWGDKTECYVDDVTLDEARKRCIEDNIFRENYTSYQFEQIITDWWDTGKYESHEQLGKTIKKSGQRVGQLIDGRKCRVELIEHDSKGAFTASTETILASKPLKNITDRARLIDLVENGKIHATDTKKVAKLCQSDKILNRMILYKGIPYNQVMAEFQNKISKETKKKKTKTIAIENPQLAEDIYKTVSRNIDTYLLTLNDSKSKKTAINYLKMTVAVISEALYRDGIINEEQFKQIRDDILEVYMDSLKDYDGEPLNVNTGMWLKEGTTRDVN